MAIKFAGRFRKPTKLVAPRLRSGAVKPPLLHFEPEVLRGHPRIADVQRHHVLPWPKDALTVPELHMKLTGVFLDRTEVEGCGGDHGRDFTPVRSKTLYIVAKTVADAICSV